VIGAKLKSARVAAGMSIRGLADKVGLSHSAIHKYESDRDVPGSEIMIRLCRALGVKLGWLMRESSFSLSQPAFRCKAVFGQKKRDAVVEKAREYLERYLAAEEFAAPDTAPFVRPVTIHDRDCRAEDAEDAADKLRRAWGLGLDPVNSLLEFVESKGIKVVALDIDDEGFLGCSLFINDSLPVIIVSRKWPGDRQRFTVAHELGHLILGDSRRGREAERFADSFAGAFLLPSEAVRSELGEKRSSFSVKELHELKMRYGASMQTWIRRARDLDIISEPRFKSIMAVFSSRGWRKTEWGSRVEPERPQRLERLVYKAFAEGIISESRAAELLMVSINDFRASVQPLIGGVLGAEARC